MSLLHDFWLLRERERDYHDYGDLIGRKDAPVHIHDDLLRYFSDTLQWIPTWNPTRNCARQGLNTWGITIINHVGGKQFQRIMLAWYQLFVYGPEQLDLQGNFVWHWPYEESEHVIKEDEVDHLGSYDRLIIDRDRFCRQLLTLAEFGEKAASREFFILHCGI